MGIGKDSNNGVSAVRFLFYVVFWVVAVAVGLWCYRAPIHAELGMKIQAWIMAIVWFLLLLLWGWLASSRADNFQLDCGEVGTFSGAVVPSSGSVPLFLSVGPLKLIVAPGHTVTGPCSGLVDVAGGLSDFNSVLQSVNGSTDWGIVSTGAGDLLVSVVKNPWETFSFNLLMGLAGIVCGGGWIYVTIHHAI